MGCKSIPLMIEPATPITRSACTKYIHVLSDGHDYYHINITKHITLSYLTLKAEQGAAKLTNNDEDNLYSCPVCGSSLW